ncbi:hypothetical protein BSKO_09435 [Bryopsis sp. KO-2023]|nr:hypothetical protein BSKO_09435 [Bryopsis sp. KO-2023]
MAEGGDAGLFTDEVYEKILRRNINNACVFDVSGKLDASLRTAVGHVVEDNGNSPELILMKRGDEVEEGGSCHRRFEDCFSASARGEFEQDNSWSPARIQSPCVAKDSKGWRYHGSTRSDCLVLRVRPISPVPNPIRVPVSKLFHTKRKLLVSLAGDDPGNTSEQDFVVTLEGNSRVQGMYCVSKTGSTDAYVIRYAFGNLAEGTVYDRAYGGADPPVSVTFGHVIDHSVTLFHVMRGNMSLLNKPRREMVEFGGRPADQHGSAQHPAEMSSSKQGQYGYGETNGMGIRNPQMQGVAAAGVWAEPPGHHGGQNALGAGFPPGGATSISSAGGHSSNANHMGGAAPEGQAGGPFYGAPQRAAPPQQQQFQSSSEGVRNGSPWGGQSFPVGPQASPMQGNAMGQASAPWNLQGQDRGGNGVGPANNTASQANPVRPGPEWGSGSFNHPAPSSVSRSCSGGGGSDQQSIASGGHMYPRSPAPPMHARQDSNAQNADQDVHYSHVQPPPAPSIHQQDVHGSTSGLAPSPMLTAFRRDSERVADGQSSISSRTDPISAAPMGGCQPCAPQQPRADPKTLAASTGDIVELLRAMARVSRFPLPTALLQKLCASTPEMTPFFRVLGQGHASVLLAELRNETQPATPSQLQAPHQNQTGSKPFSSEDVLRTSSRQSLQPPQNVNVPNQSIPDRGSQTGSDSVHSQQPMQSQPPVYSNSNQGPFSFKHLLAPAASDKSSQLSTRRPPQVQTGAPMNLQNSVENGGHQHATMPGAMRSDGRGNGVGPGPFLHHQHHPGSHLGQNSGGGGVHHPQQHGGGGSHPAPGMAKGEIPAQELRGYQANAVELMMSSGENCLVKAPTGSGKTRMFVEAARRLLMINRDARIIVAVPTVFLTEQQMAYFDKAGFSANGYHTKAVYGGQKLDRNQFLEKTVLVTTMQVLGNKLEDKTIMFGDFQMLVLDEAHHVRKASSYANVMKQYRNLPVEMRAKIQVLGFTASPSRGTGVCEASNSLFKLLEEMGVHPKNLIEIPEDNEEVKAEVPKATEELIKVDSRSLDVDFLKAMTAYLRDALKIYHDFLGEKGLGDVQSVRLFDKLKPGECMSSMEDWRNRSSAAIDLQKSKFDGSISDALVTDLKEGLEVISIVNIALDEVSELGCEVVLKKISSGVAEKVGHGVAADPSRVVHRLVSKLRESPGVRMAEAAPPVDGLGPTTADSGTLPRFACLLDVLCRERFQGPEFHCLVFVRTISAVNEIHRMLETSLRVNRSIEFRPLVGHGQKRRQQLVEGNPNSSFVMGMTGNQQKEVIDWFSESGRKVLVATSAAEEGLDVRSCELVVRYSVTVTGVERIQSRGRARMKGGLYVNIVEKGSREARLYNRSKLQEESGEAMLSLVDAVRM